MNLKHAAHILLFVLAVFVSIPVLCDTAYADIVSIESVSDNQMDPQALEADDLAGARHIYISKPELCAPSVVEGSGGITLAAPPVWWRPPMPNAV